jgi:hypothetical protein
MGNQGLAAVFQRIADHVRGFIVLGCHLHVADQSVAIPVQANARFDIADFVLVLLAIDGEVECDCGR